MPQKLAAKRDLAKNEKRHEQNLKIKTNIKEAVKVFKKALAGTDAGSKKEALTKVYASLDKAVTKKVIHKNNASRKKSRLAIMLAKIK